VHVVGAGYDDSLFVQTPKPHPEPVQIVYAGKLCKAKGVPWMLRALATIDAPDWHLNLVGGGSGEEKTHCLQLAERLGDRVTVHGSVTQRHLAGIMAQSHLFVLSSFFEGLPLVMLEALASGCRIIATDLPGVMTVLKGVNVDFISLVRTPRLIGVDTPVKADEGRYERDLADALRYQISMARQKPDTDLSVIKEMMRSYTWRGIFEKVQDVYYAATR
jgi:glycosyltransferase involved in cell wall biosynthesis